jgi:molybdopterin-guanine dinucleotide biosynthesis protein A
MDARFEQFLDADVNHVYSFVKDPVGLGHPAENGISFSVIVAAKPTRVRTFQAVVFPRLTKGKPTEKGGQTSRRPSKGNSFLKKKSVINLSECECVILAGGGSTRMGRAKAELRLGRRTLLGHARALSAELGLPCRVQTHDDTPGQGPLGGVATALRRARANGTEKILFLGCDMPFLTAELTQRILAVEANAVFASVKGTVGFPFVLSPVVLPKVEAQLTAGRRSLQRLSVRLRARRIRVLAAEVEQLQNLNTPADFAVARRRAGGRSSR